MARHVNHPIRLIRRNRRPLAAALAASAVLVGWQALQPHNPPTVSVAVATHSLPAGSRLSEADVVMADVAAQLAPPGWLRDARRAIGSVTAVLVEAGEPLSSARLLSRTISTDPQRPSNRPMPVRISDTGAARLIRPGNRLDILSSPGAQDGESRGGAYVVAANILVLANLADDPAQGSALLGGSSASDSNQGSLLLVSADAEQALRLAAAEAASKLTFTMVE